MTSKNSLTSEQLRKLLDYDPHTGILRWLVKARRRSFWKIAGNICKRHGYVQVMIDGENYVAHRLIWRMVSGEWPTHQIDHKDLNRSNNRWLNLRPATNKQNSENHSLRTDNTSGVVGVCWSPRHGRWRAFITHYGKQTHLGYHDDFETAVNARREGEQAFFTHAPITPEVIQQPRRR